MDVYLPVSGSLVAYRLPYGVPPLPIRTSGGRILAAGEVPEIRGTGYVPRHPLEVLELEEKIFERWEKSGILLGAS